VTIFYPDVSNNNWGGPGLTDGGANSLYSFLTPLLAQGFAGVCHKMSQGGGANAYVDPYGALCQAWCAQNGVPFLGYHWVTCDPAQAQADNWRAAGGGECAMLDWEAGGGPGADDFSGDIDNFWAVTNAFNAANVNVAVGYNPRWYLEGAGSGAGTDLSAFATAGIALVSSGYPAGSTADYAWSLYFNQCGGDGGEGWAPYDGATPAAWQFTSSAIVSGVGGVDVNAYKGADINTLFGTAAPPKPPPAGPPDSVVVNGVTLYVSRSKYRDRTAQPSYSLVDLARNDDAMIHESDVIRRAIEGDTACQAVIKTVATQYGDPESALLVKKYGW